MTSFRMELHNYYADKIAIKMYKHERSHSDYADKIAIKMYKHKRSHSVCRTNYIVADLFTSKSGNCCDRTLCVTRRHVSAMNPSSDVRAPVPARESPCGP